MSKTFRRKNIESKGKNQRGSRVSGRGYYAQENFIEFNHPTQKIKTYEYLKNPWGVISYKWIDTDVPMTVYFPYYTEWDEKLFHKEYWNNHRDKPSGSHNAPKTFRQFKNQQFRRKYVQYIHRLINNKNELSNIEPKHKKNINWEWW